MDINHSTDDISTSAGAPPTLGGNRIFHEFNSIIRENFIIGGDLATNGTNPYQRGTSGTASNATYMADRIQAIDSVAFTTEPTWAQTIDGLTITSNEATSHSGYALFNHKIEGYDVTKLFNSVDYFTLQGKIKSSLSGIIYVAIRSSGLDATYVFPIVVSAGITKVFSEVIPVPVIGTFGTGSNLGMDIYICRSQNDVTAHTSTFNQWQAGAYLSGPDQLDLHATNGATISIDKLKLEPGQIATQFWTPDAGTEKRRCMRYYQEHGRGLSGMVNDSSGTLVRLGGQSDVRMRTGAPVMALLMSTPVVIHGNAFVAATGSTLSGDSTSEAGFYFLISGFTGLTQFRPCISNTDKIISLTDEL